MNYNPNVQPIRSALIVYLQGLEELYQGDLTIAYPVARVSSRRLLETLAMSDAKEETALQIAERIIDATKELKEVKP